MVKKKLNRFVSGIIFLLFLLGIFVTGCRITIYSEWGHWETDGQYLKCVPDPKSRECRITGGSATTDSTFTPDNRW